jgi:competence protein ComEC
VIETGAGQVILIDGGSSSRSGIGRYQILPYLKYRGISYVDAIFISHTDADHINGISLLLELVKQHLTTIQIGSLVLPGWKNPPEEWQELKTLAQNAGIRVVSANAGDEYRAGKLSVKVLSPGQEAQGNDTNEEALVLQLEYGGIKSLFTGDIGAETEEKLLDVLEDVDILKVAHHGSRYSTCQAFLEKTNPETAVVSCSATNSYGHPAEETIERLDEAGAQVEYTMNSGAIQIETHGSGYRVRRFLETS